MDQQKKDIEKDKHFSGVLSGHDPEANNLNINKKEKDLNLQSKGQNDQIKGQSEEKDKSEKQEEERNPHRRYNPLTGEWILVCPQRILRPWSGQKESSTTSGLDSQTSCLPVENALSPGATRANGLKNPNYSSTFVFTNDFPALIEGDLSLLTNGKGENSLPTQKSAEEDPLFQRRSVQGTCRVMCFHPRSDQTLPLMTLDELNAVIDEWKHQFEELSSKYIWVQIFENKGTAMGCSNPFPHCQIWACSYLPSIPALKDLKLLEYYQKYKRPLLADYILQELERRERIIIENIDWLVVVPYWAAWPFETLIISRNNNKRLNDLTKEQRLNLARTMKELLIKYDNLFQCSFPYSMGFHGAPTGPKMSLQDDSHWTLHAIYYPPLLRSASIRKFMVGFELLGEVQRDLTPELAAKYLREANGQIHYSQK